ncbi:MAG: DNA translocase FtsK 4TM domain-containing protein [Thermodesulfobacteriota bacterium]|nr:DNA translocase FtsK 4TM domain-containing protein [Thermodesulfobacteriota bacterium]
MNKKAKRKTNTPSHPTAVSKEIGGIIFLLLAIIFGVSLFSYHPDDPSSWLETSHQGEVYNLFGIMGAYLAGAVFFFLGFSSFWLIAIFLTLAFFSFFRHPFFSPIKNTIAISALILSFSGILNLQLPEAVIYRGGRVISGGLVGLRVSGFMEGFLNYFGAYVLLLGIFIISLMVCTRISFGWIFSKILMWVDGIIRSLNEIYTKKKERRRKRRARIRSTEKEKIKPKRKVTIIEPQKETLKKPEQESFPFMNIVGEFKLPPLNLLDDPPGGKNTEIQHESLEMNARRLEKKLLDFGVDGEVMEILPGPVITMYEFKPAPGVKISKVAGLSDDLALALRAHSVRIVAPIHGKAAIGIEIANNKREAVYLSEVLSTMVFKNSTHKLTIALGKDITGSPVIADLARMPHLLVAGATGTGKSVSLNAMINSLLFKVSPDMVRFLMIDPKRIELSVYQDIPHLLHPVVTEPKDATKALIWAVQEMERRYMLLSDKGVRNIEAYNRKILKGKKTGVMNGVGGPEKSLAYIIVVIDELADLMMVSSRDVEEAITRLAQMARAAGICRCREPVPGGC